MRNKSKRCKITSGAEQLPPDSAEYSFADDGIGAACRKSHHVQRWCPVMAARRPRGFHLVTDEITANLPTLPVAGLVHLFIKHTSAGLSINENADPDVRTDLSAISDRLVRERESYYVHTLEGDDDMPAHAKSTLTGVELTIPVTQGRLNLGTWQGIYLCEFRNRASGRRIVATLIG